MWAYLKEGISAYKILLISIKYGKAIRLFYGFSPYNTEVVNIDLLIYKSYKLIFYLFYPIPALGFWVIRRRAS